MTNVARLREPSVDAGVVWEEPPQRAGRRAPNLGPRLDALRRRPNVWGRVWEWGNTSSASSFRKRVEADVAMDEFEFRSGHYGDKGSALWARWVGDGTHK